MTSIDDNLIPYTEEELNARLDESEADIEAGRVISSEEMRRRRNKLLEEDLTPYTMEELTARINASVAAAKAGQLISAEEILS